MGIQGTIKRLFRTQITGHRIYQQGLWLLLVGLVSVSVSAQADLILNGSSIYSDLGKDQFAAALYLETPQKNPGSVHSMEGERRMEVRILNNYSKRRWFNLWMQSISINNSRETFSKSAQDLITLMQAAKSAPQKGDFIEYLSSSDQGTSMRFNGTELVADLPVEIFGLLLNTWIGAIPPSTNFKQEILGNQRHPEAMQLLETVTTDPQRTALAASWILPPKPKTVKVAVKPAIKKTPKAKALAVTKPKEKITSASVSAVAAKVSVTENTKKATINKMVVAKPAADIISSASAALTKAAPTKTASIETAPSDKEVAADADSEDELDFSVAEALAMRDYTPLVVQKIYKEISYPSRAINRGFEGTVRMAIVVSKTGALESATIAQESKHSILNQAAIKATERAAPFPELPAALNTDQFEITVPITFKLK
jgi:protein TonB